MIFLRHLRKNPYNNKTAGFTLIELLLVVSLLAISVGVTGDVITSLIRSYTKIQVQNDIEQNANFASLKLEKEIRNASYTLLPYVNGSGAMTLFFLNSDATKLICYRVSFSGGAGVLQRGWASTSGGIPGACTNYTNVTNTSQIGGVYVTCNVLVPGLPDCFKITKAPGGPEVVKVHLEFTQANVGYPTVSGTGNVIFDTSIVVRGTY
ncbi:hypothetical protein A3A69_02450 [candidate division WWE3 bacterium RIFCSPLOWO2_01_FULL_37_15]|uniref:Uncharacterized protein n=1 Tax=candidate division WWE3 bacterium RIFCSPLOWO2_01_FULL_37_15 TaxID=1802622 RepID=A0A1F4V3B1_UNCKA|nr:MAG: hypothetical protein A3A69_02450 [candidate division WWE3 bacterium RIFCSPLOWO2_01_FULL_37_15]